MHWRQNRPTGQKAVSGRRLSLKRWQCLRSVIRFRLHLRIRSHFPELRVYLYLHQNDLACMLQMRSHLFLSWLESNTWAFVQLGIFINQNWNWLSWGIGKNREFALMGQPHWERHHRGLFLLVRETIIRLVKLSGFNRCSWAEKMIPFESGSLYDEPGCPYCVPPGPFCPTRNAVTVVEIGFWTACA